ncbi:MAG TPA: O-sialoglycoprotein endopeptidase [Firmicutes bacterium]|uniref:N(6)-L-threonylcarbamoyladenine synthase n=1 Tax=Capillibacterium thermochitinicola TaxID=2699427 RepID=A0A8J6HX05_9FIRM|nr:O-sialoglycoprotein endopeptidase [Capillibacterium thermochitinicola]HHW11794.1 O-sialoglycoprotein endopeptidase [Bacillota bacterium]
MSSYYLGLDTSCYTTSLALTDAAGRILQDQRRVLTVEKGAKGLRQSEALFQHLKNLPALVEEAAAFRPLKGVAYAARPRPVDGSYLPVFLAGANFARVIAATAGVPLLASSHQEGHIRAALEGAGLASDAFLGLHLSGGTTELLAVQRKTGGFAVKLLGGTSDLHAGQMIDRIGVAMGLPFPAGPHLEALAQGGQATLKLPVAVQGLTVSFSGPTSAALRLWAQKPAPADLARAVLDCLVESVFRLVQAGVATGEPGGREVLLFGGVASNTYLRRELTARVARWDQGVRVYFGKTELSADNAVGLALLARDYFTSAAAKGGTEHGEDVDHRQP